MKKLFTLIGALLLWQAMAVAQNYLHISSGESTEVVPMAELDSVTVRDANFYGSAWWYLGTGTYTYTQYVSGIHEDRPIYTRNANDEGTHKQYQVRDWYFGNPLVIDYDEATGDCWVEPQFTGYVHSSYGNLWVAEADLYAASHGKNFNEGHSSFDPATGLFQLYLIYYVDAGYFGYGYETLQLDGVTRAPSRNREVQPVKLEAKPLVITSKATGKRVPLTLTKPAAPKGSEQLKMHTSNEIVK
jgi:hypothetical protein